MSDYDKVLTSIGDFGTYQKRLCLLLFLICIPDGVYITSVVFNNVTPEFRCAVPGLINDTYNIQDSYHKSLVETYIPKDKDSEQYSHCKAYNVDDMGQLTDRNKTDECQRWVYDKSGGVVSQIVEFNLVCDKVLFKAHNNLVILLGILVGSIIGGPMSDRFGRKKILLGCAIFASAIAAVMSALDSFILVLICRFMSVVCAHTQYLAGYVMLAETVGVKKRSIVTLSTVFGYATGLLFSTLVQFLLRDWRTAQLVSTLPFLILILCWWLIQESPRWLLSKNRQKEAKDVIVYIAKVNKVNISWDMEVVADTSMMKMDGIGVGESGKDEETTTSSSSNNLKIWHICTSRRYVLYLTILCFSWITVNMVYYGMVLGAGDIIEGDIYVTFILLSVMEIPSHVMCALLLEKIDRKVFYCSSMITSGLATLGIGALVIADQDIRWLSITFFCLGKMCISIGFDLIYIITTELCPTKIRNSGLGFCSCVARFSGILSPYIVSASLLIPGPIGKALPVLIFGVLSLASGVFAILLPETRNAELPETIESDSGSDVSDNTRKSLMGPTKG